MSIEVKTIGQLIDELIVARVMEQTGVYVIRNRAGDSESMYIGSTAVSFKRRWGAHRAMLRANRHYNRHLQRAWNLYGEENFQFAPLEFADCPEQVRAREQYWLEKFFNSQYRGLLYNVSSSVRASMEGRRASPETKRKLSVSLTGRSFSDEHRRNLSKVGKGHVVSPAARAKIRDARAKLYPEFVNTRTRERIPAGRNLKALCGRLGLCYACMNRLLRGRLSQHCGWVIANTEAGNA